MNHFVHALDGVFYFATPILFLAAIILWAVALCSILAARRTQWPTPPMEVWPPRAVRCGMAFVGIVASLFVVGGIAQWAALDEIRPLLASDIQSVSVNGRPVAASEKLVSALRGMRTIAAHHSYPTVRYTVVLQTRDGPLTLLLRRDSSVPDEYWVFYPGYRSTTENEVARVSTDALNAL